jgi:hypothetical protein
VCEWSCWLDGGSRAGEGRAGRGLAHWRAGTGALGLARWDWRAGTGALGLARRVARWG